MPSADSATTRRLQVGDAAPAFTIDDDAGHTVSLDDFRGHRLVIYFYPAAATPGCTTQACDFRDNWSDFDAAGFTVIGISPDPSAKLAEFRADQHLGFPLLSDPARSVLTAYGAYGEKVMYGRTVTGVIRSTVVVGADGLVELAQYNVRATGHVAKLLRDLGLN